MIDFLINIIADIADCFLDLWVNNFYPLRVWWPRPDGMCRWTSCPGGNGQDAAVLHHGHRCSPCPR